MGCVFPIVFDPLLPHVEIGPDDHLEDACHFTYFVGENTFYLKILKTKKKHDDSGTYKIVAENEVGKVSIECNVVVKEPREHQVKELDAIES